ncbi:MATE family efflux transporter [Mycoplasmatota bacterium]|nr:MATE family efflux transporter [Mycoplasmatota bacterium]
MKKNDLTQGNILKKILLVAIPAVLTSLVQMTYNLTDMFWISQVTNIGIDNTKALAAVGTAGYYLWFGFGIILLIKIGLDAFVPQCVGKNDELTLNEYVVSGILFILALAFIYSMIGYFFKDTIIGIFNLEDPVVVKYAVSYLSIMSLFIYFHFLNPVIASIFNGLGKTVVPFVISSVGVLLNIVIDPIFIITFKMGVSGAAIATVISQGVVTIIFIVLFISNKRPIKLNFTKFRLSRVKEIIKVSFPISVQSIFFTSIALYLAVIVASFGNEALATQRIGTQIESLAWMVAGGFSVALAAFVGQNIGAKKYDRIEEGYFKALKPIIIYGMLVSTLLYTGSSYLYKIFNPSNEVLRLGTEYLKILGISQLFMVIEIATQGAFNGAGKNFPPSIIGIIFNAIRIPAAILLAKEYGISGVWWAITISSVFKGIILLLWWILFMKKRRYVRIETK